MSKYGPECFCCITLFFDGGEIAKEKKNARLFYSFWLCKRVVGNELCILDFNL